MKKVVDGFSLDGDLVEAVRMYAESLSLSKSEFVNRAIRFFIESGGLDKDLKKRHEQELKARRLLHEAINEKKRGYYLR